MRPDLAGMLSQLRRDTGLSQKQAASDLNISQALLSHYENGVREPKLEFVVKACDYYGVSADYILGRANQKNTRLPQPVANRCCDSVRAVFCFTEKSDELTGALAKYLGACVENAMKILRESQENPSALDEAVIKITQAQLEKTAFDTKSRFLVSDEAVRESFPEEYKAYRENAAEVSVTLAELNMAISKGQG